MTANEILGVVYGLSILAAFSLVFAEAKRIKADNRRRHIQHLASNLRDGSCWHCKNEGHCEANCWDCD